MPDEPNLLPEALSVLAQQFALTRRDPPPERAGTITLEEVKQFLVEQITVLLDRNPALLMSILYRVDVAERDVKRVLSRSAPEAVAPDLADLLIARQLQKIRIRRTYEDDPDSEFGIGK